MQYKTEKSVLNHLTIKVLSISYVIHLRFACYFTYMLNVIYIFCTNAFKLDLSVRAFWTFLSLNI